MEEENKERTYCCEEMSMKGSCHHQISEEEINKMLTTYTNKIFKAMGNYFFTCSLVKEEKVALKADIRKELYSLVEDIEIKLPKEVSGEHTTDCVYQRTGCDCGAMERLTHNRCLSEVKTLLTKIKKDE